MAECLDHQALLGGIWCIQNGMADPSCTENAHMLDWPVCPDLGAEPPECLSEDEVAAINYCHYGAGEEPFYDGICWAYQKDPDFWDRYINTKPCAGGERPHPPPAGAAKANMLYVGFGMAAVVGMGAFMFMKKRGR